MTSRMFSGADGDAYRLQGADAGAVALATSERLRGAAYVLSLGVWVMRKSESRLTRSRSRARCVGRAPGVRGVRHDPLSAVHRTAGWQHRAAKLHCIIRTPRVRFIARLLRRRTGDGIRHTLSLIMSGRVRTCERREMERGRGCVAHPGDGGCSRIGMTHTM